MDWKDKINVWYVEIEPVHFQTDKGTFIRVDLINRVTGEIRQVDVSYSDLMKLWEEKGN